MLYPAIALNNNTNLCVTHYGKPQYTYNTCLVYISISQLKDLNMWLVLLPDMVCKTGSLCASQTHSKYKKTLETERKWLVLTECQIRKEIFVG